MVEQCAIGKFKKSCPKQVRASIYDFFVNLISSLHYNRVESILEGGVNVNNRSYWMRTIQYGAPESIDLVEPRNFDVNTAV